MNRRQLFKAFAAAAGSAALAPYVAPATPWGVGMGEQLARFHIEFHRMQGDNEGFYNVTEVDTENGTVTLDRPITQAASKDYWFLAT